MVEAEISHLQTKSREVIWSAIANLYNEAIEMVPRELQEEGPHDDEEIRKQMEARRNIKTLSLFEDLLIALMNLKSRDFTDYYLKEYLRIQPELENFPQEIIWSLVRTRYAAKNNLLAFREKNFLVPFRVWWENTLQIVGSQFAVRPALFDNFVMPSEKMKNNYIAKRIIDKAIKDGIYASIPWAKVFACKSGLVNLEEMDHQPIGGARYRGSSGGATGFPPAAPAPAAAPPPTPSLLMPTLSVNPQQVAKLQDEMRKKYEREIQEYKKYCEVKAKNDMSVLAGKVNDLIRVNKDKNDELEEMRNLLKQVERQVSVQEERHEDEKRHLLSRLKASVPSPAPPPHHHPHRHHQ